MTALQFIFLHQRLPHCEAPPRGGVYWSSGGGETVVYMRGIFILDEILKQDKIYILVGALLGSNMKHVLSLKLKFH
jgi:hypothetical protein